MGRRNIVNSVQLKKLEEAFLLGCSDREACVYANISRQTLYNYQKDNREFAERKKLLKTNPFLKARKTVVEALETDYKLAFKYLEKFSHDDDEEEHFENSQEESYGESISRKFTEFMLEETAREARDKLET